MWNWFSPPPRCPVEAADKAWIDNSLQQLADLFGIEKLRKAPVILPTPEHFPDPYQGEAADVEPLMKRVCGYLGIDPKLIDVEVYREALPQGEFYEQDMDVGCQFERVGDRFRLLLEAAHLDTPLVVIALLARELALVELVGRQQLPLETDEQEGMAELYTMFLGLGVLTANAAMFEKNWHEGDRGNFKMGFRGALTLPMYGYALARFAWLRGEQNPAWAKQLRPDVRVPFKAALRCLQESGESGSR